MADETSPAAAMVAAVAAAAAAAAAAGEAADAKLLAAVKVRTHTHTHSLPCAHCHTLWGCDPRTACVLMSSRLCSEACVPPGGVCSMLCVSVCVCVFVSVAYRAYIGRNEPQGSIKIIGLGILGYAYVGKGIETKHCVCVCVCVCVSYVGGCGHQLPDPPCHPHQRSVRS